MAEIHRELPNVFLFVICLVKVAFFTGLITVLPLALCERLFPSTWTSKKRVRRG